MSLVVLARLLMLLVTTSAVIALLSESSTKDAGSRESANNKQMMQLSISVMEGRAIIERARVFEDDGEINEALEKYDQALALFQKVHDEPANIAYLHAQIGRIQTYKDYHGAVRAFSKSHDLYRSLITTTNGYQFELLNNFAEMLYFYGLAHWHQDQGMKMSKIWEECLSTYEVLLSNTAIIDASHLARVGLIHFHLHEAYFKNKNFDSSTHHFQQSMELFEQVFIHYGIAAFHEFLPPPEHWNDFHAYTYTQSYVKSFAYDIDEDEFLTLDDMMDILDTAFDNKNTPFILTDLEHGEFYYVLGVLNYEKGDIDTAEQYLYKSMQNVSFNFKRTHENAILCLIGVYLRQARFQKSSTAHKKLLELSKKEMQGKEGDKSFSGGMNAVENFLPIEAEINQFESTITLDVNSYLRQMTNATDVFANK